MALSVLILLVEDDEAIQEMVADTFKEGGFDVASARNAEDAIGMLEASDARYHALVTDVNLSPGKLTGWDVARCARRSQPELPVVYMTGAGGQDWASNGVPNSVLITKPFDPAQVVIAVSQLLNRGNTPGEDTKLITL